MSELHRSSHGIEPAEAPLADVIELGPQRARRSEIDIHQEADIVKRALETRRIELPIRLNAEESKQFHDAILAIGYILLGESQGRTIPLINSGANRLPLVSGRGALFMLHHWGFERTGYGTEQVPNNDDSDTRETRVPLDTEKALAAVRLHSPDRTDFPAPHPTLIVREHRIDDDLTAMLFFPPRDFDQPAEPNSPRPTLRLV